MKRWMLILLLVLRQPIGAEEPSLTHYLSIKEEDGVLSELILKVKNPTERVLWVWGQSISDIPHQLEVLRNGKWSVVPPRRCGFGMRTRAFLPHSEILFTAIEAPLDEPDLTFRIRVFLYTVEDITSLYVNPPNKSWVECVSPIFKSNDFRMKPRDNLKLPRIPGAQPIEDGSPEYPFLRDPFKD